MAMLKLFNKWLVRLRFWLLDGVQVQVSTGIRAEFDDLKDAIHHNQKLLDYALEQLTIIRSRLELTGDTPVAPALVVTEDTAIVDCPDCSRSYDLMKLGLKRTQMVATVACECGAVMEIHPHKHAGWKAPSPFVRERKTNYESVS